MAAFLQALFGPLLALVDFLTGCFPHFVVIRQNELGVRYPAGGTPVELRPDRPAFSSWLRATLRFLRLRRLADTRGVHAYFPVIQTVSKHFTCRQVLAVDPIVIESHDGVPHAVGLVLTYRIVDVIAFEVGYYDADDSLAELAEGALRKLVLRKTAAQLCDSRQPLDEQLANACRSLLSEVGVEVVSARLTEQARIEHVAKVFGVQIDAHTQLG